MLSSPAMNFLENSSLPVGAYRAVSGHVPTGTKDPLWLLCGARVSELRTKANLPATTVSSLAGLNSSQVSVVEDGKRCPQISTIEKLAGALGVSPAWLAFGHQGFEPFQQRRPRDVIEPEIPTPDLTERPSTERYKSVGDRCRRIRMLRGLSLRAAASAAGISHESLNLIEKGSTIPLVATCERLAVAFDVAPAWLTYGEGEVPEGIAGEERAAASD